MVDYEFLILYRGYEMAADDAVRLIRDTGGISSLAHPWSLKDPLSVVKRLKSAGLHAIEVYRGNGKASGMFVDLFLQFLRFFCVIVIVIVIILLGLSRIWRLGCILQPLKTWGI